MSEKQENGKNPRLGTKTDGFEGGYHGSDEARRRRVSVDTSMAISKGSLLLRSGLC